MAVYGYARVSSREQNLERQVKMLIDYGINLTNIYTEKKSGKNLKREKYQELLNDVLKVGDTLVITELDRLGRNMQEIEEQYKKITVDRGCYIKILKEDFLSTTSSEESKIFKDMLQPVLLKVISYLAENERERILKRQQEAYNSMKRDDKGRLITKAGKIIGREAKFNSLKPEEKKLIKDWINGKISGVRVSNILNLSRPTLYKIKNQYLEEEIQL